MMRVPPGDPLAASPPTTGEARPPQIRNASRSPTLAAARRLDPVSLRLFRGRASGLYGVLS